MELRGKMLFMVNLLVSYKEPLRRDLPYGDSKINLRKRNSRENLSKTNDLIIFLSHFCASMEFLPSTSW